LPHRKSTDDGADLVGHEAGLQYAGDESVGRDAEGVLNGGNSYKQLDGKLERM
jgi:hypothetical protein